MTEQLDLSDMLEDSKGRLVPRRLIKDSDIARDSLVRELTQEAIRLSAEIARFKARVLGDLQAFVELSADQYGVKMRGEKGNLTLLTYDGRYRVTRQVADQLVFDERLQVAKQLVDDCIVEWAEGARDEIRTLVGHAFQVDKHGRVSTERILNLRKLHIEAPKWAMAMKAIGDSISVVSSSTYVRFYERIGDSESWRPISLDIASATEVP